MQNTNINIIREAPRTKNRLPFSRDFLDKTIHERFEYVVSRIPDSVAVNDMGVEYSYEEINSRANYLAREILKHKQSNGDQQNAVGLILGHNVDIVIGILGTLKSGGFFIPIDPALPPNRVSYLIKDSQAKILITNNKYMNLPNQWNIDQKLVINIDDRREDNECENISYPCSSRSVSNLVYTSGSTGNPKGVVYQHRNLLHAAWWWGEIHSLGPGDRVSLISSFSYGGSVLHSIRTLLNGAALYLFDVKVLGLRNLIDWIQLNEITILNASPSTFRQFAPLINKEDSLHSIRFFYTGGETVRKSDVDLFNQHFTKNTILRLGGGMTEALIIACCFLEHGSPLPSLGVPMGYIVPDKEVQIWDENNHPVEEGEIGEIVVKSRFLSAGYWNRPELNQQKFLPDPEGSDAQFYKSGDLGVLSSNGVLFHKGRKDFQIKIRGQRVELGEIEMTLIRMKGISEAAVVGRQDEDGETRLIAYIIPSGEMSLLVSDVRKFLLNELPDHMVPVYYYFLDEFPKTVSMKIDYGSLPVPGHERPALDAPVVSPKSRTEEKLVEIWSDILKISPVGINDSFFELGGHSLHITQMINRIIKEFKISLTIRQVYEAPTITELSKIIDLINKD